MPALLLYLATTTVVLWAWSRYVEPLARMAAIVLVLLPLCFTGRALLTGRVYAPIDLPFMSEPLHSHAAEYGTSTPHNAMLSDLYQQIIPWRAAVAEAWRDGAWPLLNPHMLCGDILAASAQPAPYDPFNLIALLIPLAAALTFSATITFFIAAFSAFVFARSIGCRDTAALFAAAGWMCSANMAFFVGWPIARSWALLPLLLVSTRLLVRETSIRSCVLLTGTLILEIVSGHPETLLHVVAVAVIYAVFEKPRVRAIGLAFACGTIAIALTAIFLLPFIEAGPQTVQYGERAEMARAAAHTNRQIITTRARSWLLPHGDRVPDSGGVGFVVIALSLLALGLARRKRETWFFAALAIVCLVAGMDMPPLFQLLHRLPLFDIAVNHYLIFAADFGLVLLAAFSVDTFGPNVRIACVALLLIERVLEVGSMYPTIPRRAFYPRVPSLAAIPRSREPFRIAGLAYQFIPDSAVFYGLEDVRGYSAMTNVRLSMTYPLWCSAQPVSFNRIDDASKPFLSFLNVRYLLAPVDESVPAQWKLIAQDGGTKLYENSDAIPRVFIPPRVRYQKSSTDALLEMLSADGFRERVWIELPEYQPADIVNGTGHLVVRRARLGLDIDAVMDSNGWIIASETHWKGWRAYIDGRRAETRFANVAFIGVHVPAGHHHVQLVYLPESFTRGRAISFGTLALLIITALSRSAIRARRRAPHPA